MIVSNRRPRNAKGFLLDSACNFYATIQVKKHILIMKKINEKFLDLKPQKLKTLKLGMFFKLIYRCIVIYLYERRTLIFAFQ